MRKIKKDIASCIHEKVTLIEILSQLSFRLPNLATIIYCEENLHMPSKEFCFFSSEEVAELMADDLNFDKEFILDCGKALKRYLERTEHFEEIEQIYGCSALEYHYELVIEDK